MAFNLRNAVVASAAALALPAAASAQSACSSQFFQGEEPIVHNADANHAVSLCNDSYTALYDVKTQDPIYSAEHLTRGQIQQARPLHFVGRFDKRAHDVRVPSSPNAGDYLRYGYEHGQMSASADAPTTAAQLQTYKLTNIVPQVRALKFGPWLGVEESARTAALKDGDVYVVSGPAFLNGENKTIGRKGAHIRVPSHTWKAVLDVNANKVAAHLCTNTHTPSCELVPYGKLVQLTGVNAFPALKTAPKHAPLPAYNDNGVFTHSPGDDWYDISADKTDPWTPKDQDNGIDIDVDI